MASETLTLTMTEADKAALERCPDGWFVSQCVELLYTKNADYRCGRLVERGMLETDVVGDYPNLQRLYRKVEATNGK
jgi:hypothetical protein